MGGLDGTPAGAAVRAAMKQAEAMADHDLSTVTSGRRESR